MAYQVRPSKGDFLLHTVMNVAGYNDNNRMRQMHPLRLKTRAHYAKEINNPIVLEFYNVWISDGIHNHPHWGALVDIQRIEHGCEPSKHQTSLELRNLLNRFRASTDFDAFYAEVLSEYEAICGQVRDVISGVPFEQTLGGAWELQAPHDVHIIPRPLDKPYHGDGPAFQNTICSIIGPGWHNGMPTFSDPSLRQLVGHEVSHTYAKALERDVELLLRQRGTWEQVSSFAKKQKARGYEGFAVLDETLIRAMQSRYIDPLLGSQRTVDEQLDREFRMGFEHIYEFDNALRSHKDNPKGSLAEAVVDLATRLSCTQK